ncbi:MAG: nucleotidyltransferase domain-containing protein [Nitrososphaerota archaeon]
MLNSLTIKDKRYLNDLKEYLDIILNDKDKNVIAVLLFGSLSKNLAKPYPESDIDLLIIAKNLPRKLIERKFQIIKLKKYPMAIEDLWLTPEELMEGIEGGWGVILDALSDGIPIYDPENILKNAKEILNKKYKRIGKIWVLNDKLLKHY